MNKSEFYVIILINEQGVKSNLLKFDIMFTKQKDCFFLSSGKELLWVPFVGWMDGWSVVVKKCRKFPNKDDYRS